ncbi:pentatricopeptide repeat-containing protein, chloroplastic [Iris pallida]|uniref:Pentatricopeptide repeat-containing protein, chloroplastic n=1 Tax=Iris pallida TaxID=29817 RepID=A0AAX6EDL0_IRIPA|nr:pentatricopeptide repeat-containing protein, chloroplastic [Iris pallida]
MWVFGSQNPPKPTHGCFPPSLFSYPVLPPAPPPPSTTLLLHHHFPWPKTPKPQNKLRVSLQEDTPTPFMNSIWINPNSPNAPLLRRASSGSRYARLADISASLDLSADPLSFLPLSFPKPPSEQDAVVVLNHMSNPDSSLAAFSWFRAHIANPSNPTILFNVTLKALRKSRSWAPIEPLLLEMIDSCVSPDNVTFWTVISCARLCDLPAKAIEWFERMPEFGLTPDDVTCSAMIDAYGRLGDMERSLRLYECSREERRKLDWVAFATMVRVHAASGNFDSTLNVFEEMKALRVKPNLVIYNTLLDAMGRAGRPWQVKSIYKEMGCSGLVANRGTYSALS